MSVINQIHQCHFCNRCFHFKELFEKHEPVCEFFYKSKRERQYEDEKIEQLPTLQDMFKLIQKMYIEMNQQKTKIEHLERIIRVRNKTNSLLHSPIPTSTFTIWAKSIQVKNDHLLFAFRNGVFEGIRKCLFDEINEKGLTTLPIRTPLEKSNILYVYKKVINGIEYSNKWCICDSSDILYLVEQLMDKFMEEYCIWEDNNQEWISSSNENKELHIDYLCKISGSLIHNKEKKRQELRNWLCKQVLYDPTEQN